MKIRNGYVSNSSSSSFLVISFNKINDFIKFKEFDGYNTFMKDIEKDTEEESKVFICSILTNHYFHEHMKFLKKNTPDINLTMFDYLYYLFEQSGVDDTDYWNIISETNKIGADFWLKNRENLESNKIKDEIRAYEECYYNNKENKLKIKNIANKIYDGLKAKGINVNFIRYEDDTYEGAYMEIGFMPFLMANPEKNYCIISQSEH